MTCTAVILSWLSSMVPAVFRVSLVAFWLLAGYLSFVGRIIVGQIIVGRIIVGQIIFTSVSRLFKLSEFGLEVSSGLVTSERTIWKENDRVRRTQESVLRDAILR